MKRIHVTNNLGIWQVFYLICVTFVTVLVYNLSQNLNNSRLTKIVKYNRTRAVKANYNRFDYSPLKYNLVGSDPVKYKQTGSIHMKYKLAGSVHVPVKYSQIGSVPVKYSQTGSIPVKYNLSGSVSVKNIVNNSVLVQEDINKFINNIEPMIIPRDIPDVKCNVVVPNIVHYIWFHKGFKQDFVFHKFVCVLSVIKIQQPELIIFWHDSVPVGKWWDLLMAYVSHKHVNFQMRHTDAPEKIHGKTIIKPEHKADVHRLWCVETYGGIYVDMDVIIVNPFTSLMCHNFTLGKEDKDHLNNGVIISVPNAPFVKYWREKYRHMFKPEGWQEASIFGSTAVAKEHPELIHIEESSLQKPNYRNVSYIYNRTFNWKKNYCVHLWYRYHRTEYNPQSIMYVDSALGELFRYVLYNHPGLYSKKT